MPFLSQKSIFQLTSILIIPCDFSTMSEPSIAWKTGDRAIRISLCTLNPKVYSLVINFLLEIFLASEKSIFNLGASPDLLVLAADGEVAAGLVLHDPGQVTQQRLDAAHPHLKKLLLQKSCCQLDPPSSM